MTIVQAADAARSRRADAHLRQLRQASRSDRSKPIPAARLREPFRNAGLAVQYLRAACPADFPPSLPVYLVSSDDAPDHLHRIQPTWLACTCLKMSSTLSDVLIQRGAWQGDGFCAFFHQQRFDEQRARFGFDRSGDPYRLMFQCGLGIVAHEAAHYIHEYAADSFSRVSRNDDRHGVAFVRVAAHIWHRVSDFTALGLRDVHLPVDAGCVYSTLAAELAHRRNERIADVLRTDPPPAFVRLFR